MWYKLFYISGGVIITINLWSESGRWNARRNWQLADAMAMFSSDG